MDEVYYVTAFALFNPAFSVKHLKVISHLTACILLSLTLLSHITFSPLSSQSQPLFSVFMFSLFSLTLLLFLSLRQVLKKHCSHCKRGVKKAVQCLSELC